MRIETRQFVCRCVALLALSGLLLAVLYPLKGKIEQYIYDHNSRHVQVTYYKDRGGDEVMFRHRMDRIDLDYEEHAKLGWLDETSFFARWEGRLHIPADDKYTFEVSCEEHAVFFLDGAPIVDSQRALAIGKIRMGNVTNLTAGIYPFRLEYEHRDGDAWIKVKWRRGDSKPRVLTVPHIRR